jgi:thioredoxin 2
MITTCPKCGAKNRVDERVGSMRPVCGRCGTALPTTAETSPIVVTDATFADVALAGGVPVLVDCWAPWCGPCRMVGPTIDALAAESGGRYRIAKLNTDQNPATAARFNISSIPTMLIFHHGQLVDRLVGVQSKTAIASKLAEFSATAANA